jgi:DNA-directed RNA polymerase subunit RPC12/RpoP
MLLLHLYVLVESKKRGFLISRLLECGMEGRIEMIRYRCSRCDIPDFLALSMHVIDEMYVCEKCVSETEKQDIAKYPKLLLRTKRYH